MTSQKMKYIAVAYHINELFSGHCGGTPKCVLLCLVAF